MKNGTYIDKLYIEYNQAIKDKKTLGFKEWLELKNKYLNEYYRALSRLESQKTQIIELGKGNLDSIVLGMKDSKKLIEISDYISIIENNGINKIKGHLTIDRGNLVIQNGEEKKLHNLRNQQYAIQLPIDEDTLQLAKYLMLIDEKVYFGAYGNTDDNDFIKKNKILDTFCYQIESCGVELENNIVDNNDVYALVYTNKVKTYKK